MPSIVLPPSSPGSTDILTFSSLSTSEYSLSLIHYDASSDSQTIYAISLTPSAIASALSSSGSDEEKLALFRSAFGSATNIRFEVIVSSLSATIVVKSNVEGLTVTLGTLFLNKVDGDVANRTFREFVEQSTQAQEQVGRAEAQSDEIEQLKEDAMKVLDQWIYDKDQLEQCLFVKFSNVLNEKKQKIRSLQAVIEFYEQQLKVFASKYQEPIELAEPKGRKRAASDYDRQRITCSKHRLDMDQGDESDVTAEM